MASFVQPFYRGFLTLSKATPTMTIVDGNSHLTVCFTVIDIRGDDWVIARHFNLSNTWDLAARRFAELLGQSLTSFSDFQMLFQKLKFTTFTLATDRSGALVVALSTSVCGRKRKRYVKWTTDLRYWVRRKDQ